ncbi:hypothetical protein BAE44_0024651 [Dichanthelium oligosanthes]|uniref:Remorin C-terminal domain-containing protein n=1 Tax=Dichanthelium oligosanthes TaxID=888268 RepID=A0A1E5UN72_9POAL|nr:hypothetical protein BAE44_0024651 [Dichanthelium oligosanthes]
MAAEGPKKSEVEATPAAAKAAKDVGEEKAIVPAPGPPAGDSKALVVVDNIALAKVETEKRNSLIKAWEENEKAKAEHKAAKKLSTILSWENTKKAVVEAQLKKKEEELEKKKAEYAEKMKNKKAIIHRQAEEKRAMAMAQRGEEVLKAEEMAAKYRATGLAPKKYLGCFGASEQPHHQKNLWLVFRSAMAASMDVAPFLKASLWRTSPITRFESIAESCYQGMGDGSQVFYPLSLVSVDGDYWLGNPHESWEIVP